MKYTFKDICTKIGSGATPTGGKEAYKGGDYALVRSQNVLDYTFTTSGLAYINETQAKKLDGVKIESGDVLLNITGDSVARACIIPDEILPARVNQHVAIIRANNQYALNEYLLYFLQYNKQYLLSISQGGGTRSAITKKMIEDIEIDLPSIEDQLTIVNIINSISKKIEVNQQINDNLEQQAEALYKSWFVDFEPFKDGKFIESELGQIPEGWRIYTLNELMDIKRGSSPRPIQSYLSETGLKWLKISDATSCSSPFIYEIQEHIKSEGLRNTVYLQKGALVLSNSATPGLPKILGIDTCIHDGWLYFPISKLSNPFMYLMFIKFRENLISQANGSVFMNLKTEIVKNLKIALPKREIIEQFDLIISSVFNEIRNRTEEMLNLSKQRDTLLPKLMSGEIKINEIDC